MKGPQIALLRPGTYRINSRAFIVSKKEITKVNEEKIGIVVAMDGKPLPSGYIIAPKPENDIHRFYQDGQAFIKSGGYRGPQLDTLQPGEYYINPDLFEVKQYDVADVPPGYVAVLRSNIGLELAKGTETPPDIGKHPDLRQELHEKDEVVLTTDRNERGIWREPIAPGKYNMNFLALTPYLVPTSAVTIDWAASTDIRAQHKTVSNLEATGSSKVRRPPQEEILSEKATEFFKFSQLTLTSKDGFKLDADVRMIIRVSPSMHHS